MFEQLSKLEQRYQELERQLADPAVIARREEYQRLAKEMAALAPLVRKYRDYQELSKHAADAEHLAGGADREMAALANEELSELQRRLTQLTEELEQQILAESAQRHNRIIVEIRAGTGGSEAGLFVGDLFRMYTKYAARVGAAMEVIDSHPTEAGGFKDVIFALSGSNVYEQFKFESGTHRVQRVPETEAQGRIHTSAVTVAVLPEPEEIEIELNPSELQIDVFRASGHGGQSVNTSDSAVRIRHIPTGIVVQCQDERSQLRNKDKALRVLKARLLDFKQREQASKIAADRKSQVGSGDRSEKIRTYNFPDHRVTDHRIGLTVHQIDRVMDGELDELIAGLQAAEKLQKLGGRRPSTGARDSHAAG